MAIYSSSRYRTARGVLDVDERDDRDQEVTFVYTRRPLKINDSDIDQIHKVQVGDRLDRLAYRFGGDSRLWWVLADVNDIFGFPFDLPPGVEIIVPTAQVFQKAASGTF